MQIQNLSEIAHSSLHSQTELHYIRLELFEVALVQDC